MTDDREVRLGDFGLSTKYDRNGNKEKKILPVRGCVVFKAQYKQTCVCHCKSNGG